MEVSQSPQKQHGQYLTSSPGVWIDGHKAGLVRPDPELPDDEEEQLFLVFKEASFADKNTFAERVEAAGREDLSSAEAHIYIYMHTYLHIYIICFFLCVCCN